MQHISRVIHSFHLATATHDTHGHIELARSERKREKFLSLNFLIKLDLNRDKQTQPEVKDLCNTMA